MKAIDETGNRYGRLTVIERVKNVKKPERAVWRCLCDCGKETSVPGVSLRSGATKSCGCLQKERSSQKNTVDMTGQVFGKLTVLHREGSDEIGRYALWQCQCECGLMTTVQGKNLRSGHSHSCGCLRGWPLNLPRPPAMPPRLTISQQIALEHPFFPRKRNANRIPQSSGGSPSRLEL